MTDREVRLAAREDREDLQEIWSYCFSDSEDFVKWYFDSYWQPENTLVIDRDCAPAASLQLIPTAFCTGGQVLKAAYIVGVDCLPQYRGQGLTRALLEYAMGPEAARRGLDLLTLMPFEADFYLPYGFVFGSYHYDFDIDINEFYRKEERTFFTGYSWKKIGPEDLEQNIPVLEDVYGRWSRRFAGAVVRDHLQWQAFAQDVWIEEGQVMVMVDQVGNCVGYIAYTLPEGVLAVKELVYLDQASRAWAYYFIAGHRSQAKRVRWSAPEGEWLAFHRFKDQHGTALRPFMMYDIVRPQAAAAFAAHLPEQDVAFICDGQGYVWLKDSRTILPVDGKDLPKNAPEITKEMLTRLVFERSGEDLAEDLKRYFDPTCNYFNNEYF